MTVASREGWIQTYSGGRIFPMDPSSEDIRIEDIAHALAMTCRFGGHCKHFYSVAQHSVLVSRLVPGRLALAGLMHDAAEAYLGDIPRPIKHAKGMEEFRAAEEHLEYVIDGVFSIFLTRSDRLEIKRADAKALATERRDLLPVRTDSDWLHGAPDVPPDPSRIMQWTPDCAEVKFLQAYAYLTRAGQPRVPRVEYPSSSYGAAYPVDGGW